MSSYRLHVSRVCIWEALSGLSVLGRVDLKTVPSFHIWGGYLIMVKTTVRPGLAESAIIIVRFRFEAILAHHNRPNKVSWVSNATLAPPSTAGLIFE